MSVTSMCQSAVTLRKYIYTNVRGVRTPSATDVTSHAAVNPTSFSRTDSQGIAEAVDGAAVYFPTDPGLDTDDLILWGSKVLAVLRFGGFSSDRSIKTHCDELGKTLSEQGIETLSDFMYMGYNAPWDVINRRNEVAVEVAWKR